jgi:hypothetical protein
MRVTTGVLGGVLLALSVAMTDAGAAGRRDYNGDGSSDLLWSNAKTGATVMWLMNGGSTVGRATLPTDPEWSVMSYGDFDGDGKTDLIWRDAATGRTIMWMMDGTAFARGAILLDEPAYEVIATADFNGDGRSDIVWRLDTGGVPSVWLMDGRTFLGGANIQASGSAMLVDDFDDDGHADFVSYFPVAGTVMVRTNGVVDIETKLLLGNPNWKVIATGDFNGDGKADLVWRHVSGDTALWLMDGTTFLAGRGLHTYPWDIAGIDDFDGDGKSDILWRNSITGETAAWRMSGTTLVAGAGLLPAPWQITRTGDFNGDGKADIIFTNPLTHEKVLWLMNGLVPASGYLLSADPDWTILP